MGAFVLTACWEWTNLAGVMESLWRGVYCAAVAVLEGSVSIKPLDDEHSAELTFGLLDLVPIIDKHTTKQHYC